MSVAELVIEKLNVLAPEEQKKVLEFVETLTLQQQTVRKTDRKRTGPIKKRSADSDAYETAWQAFLATGEAVAVADIPGRETLTTTLSAMRR